MNHRPLHSCLYTGWIRHRRFSPMKHEFRMPLAMLCIQIDEWKHLFNGVPFWSSQRFNLGWLREADYLAHLPGKTLRERVNHALQKATGQSLAGPVLLVTHPRYFGFAMNPISCFYCYDAEGQNLEYLVAEVTNTPWKERIAYVIPCDPHHRQQHARFPKQMHVSPFNPMDMIYDIRFNAPQQKHYLQLENHDAHGDVITDATLVLQQEAWNTPALLNLLWRYPLMTAQVGVSIYWQALKLWLKGARYHSHIVKGAPPMNSVVLHKHMPELSQRQKISHLVARRLLCHALKGIQSGHLSIVEGEQCWEFGETTAATDLSARIVVQNGDLWATVLTRGSIGAGEAWMAGHWSSPDLTAVIRIFVRNREVLNTLDGSGSFVARLAMRTVHHLNRNTVEGSKRNISAHYDLSNDFFRRFLDETMMYSSAIFSHPSQDLYDASLNKLEIICQQLQLKETDHLVEIGSGWGGMAIYAAKNYGCHVTTVTISKEQYRYAKEKIEAEGLSDRITILLKDYRELIDHDTLGHFDKLVSIEMIEAVGADFQAEYFRICSDLLKPGGLALIQAITIEEKYYAAYLNDTDFIRHYIFPGGCLPTLERMEKTSRQHSHLRLESSRDMTLDYARTLQLWRTRFFQNIDPIKAMGFDEVFVRMWEFYFCYCEGGFLERSTGTHQVLFHKIGRGHSA